MKFAIDCDGTATRYPDIFVALGKSLLAAGHEVYVLTGIDQGAWEFNRKTRYPHLADHSWYTDVLTSNLYNDEERSLASLVIEGRMDNHVLVGIFKRRICRERGISVLFDDDVQHVRMDGEVPVFGVAKQ